MKRLVAIVHLLLFSLILIHAAFPHSHEKEALSDYPTLESTSNVHTILFLEVDLGEDHLEDFNQLDNEFHYLREHSVTNWFFPKVEGKEFIHTDVSYAVRYLSYNPDRGPPMS